MRREASRVTRDETLGVYVRRRPRGVVLRRCRPVCRYCAQHQHINDDVKRDDADAGDVRGDVRDGDGCASCVRGRDGDEYRA